MSAKRESMMTLEELLAEYRNGLPLSPLDKAALHWLTTLEAESELRRKLELDAHKECDRLAEQVRKLRDALRWVARDAGSGELADADALYALLKETEPAE